MIYLPITPSKQTGYTEIDSNVVLTGLEAYLYQDSTLIITPGIFIVEGVQIRVDSGASLRLVPKNSGVDCVVFRCTTTTWSSLNAGSSLLLTVYPQDRLPAFNVFKLCDVYWNNRVPTIDVSTVKRVTASPITKQTISYVSLLPKHFSFERSISDQQTLVGSVDCIGYNKLSMLCLSSNDCVLEIRQYVVRGGVYSSSIHNLSGQQVIPLQIDIVAQSLEFLAGSPQSGLLKLEGRVYRV